MPNSLTHLASINRMLAHADLSTAAPWLTEAEQLAAFCLGAISPDARIISGQARADTHFFDIPITAGAPSAEQHMLHTWPELAHLRLDELPRRAFVAGYITHLVMDQTWLEQIVMPALYIDGERWSQRHPNWRLYSILMTYLEFRAGEQVSQDQLEALRAAAPQAWLPFLSDHQLCNWRDNVLGNIDSGGPRRISRMFAYSNGMTPGRLEQIVTSGEAMAREAFNRVPQASLLAFEEAADRRSTHAILAYLNDLPST